MPGFPVLHYLPELTEKKKKKERKKFWSLGWLLVPAQDPSGTTEAEIWPFSSFIILSGGSVRS